MKNLENKEVRELGLKSIFSFVVNAFLILFLILLGIETLKIGQLLLGLLYFVLTALVLVPHRLLRVTHALKVVIIVVLSIIVATISGYYAPAVEKKYDTFGYEQKVNLTFGANKFSLQVKSVRPDAKISISGKDVTTSGSFVIVTVDVTNLGSKAVTFKFNTDPELIDSQNRHYTLYGKATAVGNLQPGVAKEVSYVFEIPKDASGLKLIVKDFAATAKSIDLKK
jgi:hypothetical protein